MSVDVNPYFYICTNPDCKYGVPHWKDTGKPTTRKCPECGGPLRETKSEPRR